ncbi:MULTISPECIES: hypothetical protein [unclassified Moraxella]|uniref:hypothetical protein n=1 Tax=unclassified Moraxella TaxID=2685852 RepID=UPI00359DD775
MKEIYKLYSENPDIYDIFSNDRDFFQQAADILSLLKCHTLTIKPNVIELFAGPARHSLEFVKLGCDVLSIDSALSMMQYSIKQGFQSPIKYIVSHIPNINLTVPKTNLFTLLRYSVGYMDKLQLSNLIKWCDLNSHANGLLIIELHIPSKILSLANNDMRIREREVSSKYGVVKCIWPKDIKFNSIGSLSLDMNVEISINNLAETYLSTEYIHTFDDIKFISQSLFDLDCVIYNKNFDSFGNDSLIVGVLLNKDGKNDRL